MIVVVWMCTCTFVGVYNCKPIGVDMASEICLRSFSFYFNFFIYLLRLVHLEILGQKE